jgi:TP901 family phage tail tape measure protein
MTLDASGVRTGVDQTEKAFGRVKRAGAELRSVLASIGLGVGIAQIFSETAKYEAAVKDMVKVTDRDLGTISREIMALPAELGSASDLMATYYQAFSSNARDAAQAMEWTTESAKAAKAAHTDQAQVLKGGTAILAGYSAEVQSMAEAMDLLYVMEKLGKTEFRDLIPLIGDMSKLSAAAGVKVSEMAAAFSLVTLTAGSSSEAATQYEGLIRGLYKPQERLTELLQKHANTTTLNLIAQKGLAGALQTIMDVAERTHTPIWRLFEDQSALLALTDVSKNNFADLNETLKKVETRTGMAAKAWEEWRTSLQSARDTFHSTLGKRLIEVGEVLSPDAKAGLQFLGDWLGEHKGDIADLAGDARKMATDVIAVAQSCSFMFDSVKRGWDELPDIVKEIGIILAVVGGTAAKVAIVVALQAIGKVAELGRDLIDIWDATKEGRAVLADQMSADTQTAEQLAGQIKQLRAQVDSVNQAIATKSAAVATQGVWSGVGATEIQGLEAQRQALQDRVTALQAVADRQDYVKHSNEAMAAEMGASAETAAAATKKIASTVAGLSDEARKAAAHFDELIQSMQASVAMGGMDEAGRAVAETMEKYRKVIQDVRQDEDLGASQKAAYIARLKELESQELRLVTVQNAWNAALLAYQSDQESATNAMELFILSCEQSEKAAENMLDFKDSVDQTVRSLEEQRSLIGSSGLDRALREATQQFDRQRREYGKQVESGAAEALPESYWSEQKDKILRLTKDIYQANQATEKWNQTWERMAQTLQDQLSEVFYNILDGSEDVFSGIAQAWKRMLANMLASDAITSLQNLFGSGPKQSTMMGSLFSGIGGLFSKSDVPETAKPGTGTASQLLSGLGMNSLLGGGFLDSIATTIEVITQDFGMSLFSSGGMSMLLSAIPWANIAVAAAAVVLPFVMPEITGFFEDLFGGDKEPANIRTTINGGSWNVERHLEQENINWSVGINRYIPKVMKEFGEDFDDLFETSFSDIFANTNWSFMAKDVENWGEAANETLANFIVDNWNQLFGGTGFMSGILGGMKGEGNIFERFQQEGEDWSDVVVRMVEALKGMQDLMETITETIETLNMSDMEAYIESLTGEKAFKKAKDKLDEQIEGLYGDLGIAEAQRQGMGIEGIIENAFHYIDWSVLDPTDVLAKQQELETAIVQRYELERDYVLNLVAQLEAIDKASYTFQTRLQGKIDNLTGSSETFGMVWQHTVDAWNKFQGETDPEKQLELLGEVEEGLDTAYAMQAQLMDAEIERLKAVMAAIEELGTWTESMQQKAIKAGGGQTYDQIIGGAWDKAINAYNQYMGLINKAGDSLGGVSTGMEDVISVSEARMSNLADEEQKYNLLKTMGEQLDIAYETAIQKQEAYIDSLKRVMTVLEEIASFSKSLTSKIADLRGTSEAYSDLVGAAMSDAFSAYDQYAAIQAPIGSDMASDEQRWNLLKQMAADVDTALAAATQKWTLYYDGLISGVQDQIDGLNDQKDAIQENIDALNEQKDLIRENAEAQINALELQKDALSEQKSALEKQLETAQAWSDLADSIGDQILKLKTGSSNQVDIFERLGIQRAEITRVQGLYGGAGTDEERIKYAQQLQTLYGDLLTMGQEAYQRPSAEYQAIYQEVISALETLQSGALANVTTDPVEIQRQIAAIDEQILGIDQQIADINKQMEADLASIDEQVKAQQDTMDSIDKQIADYQDQIAQYEKDKAQVLNDINQQAADYYAWIKQESDALYAAWYAPTKEKLANAEQSLADIHAKAKELYEWLAGQGRGLYNANYEAYDRALKEAEERRKNLDVQAGAYYQLILDSGSWIYAAQKSAVADALWSVIGDKTVGQYLTDLQTATVTQLTTLNLTMGNIYNRLIGADTNAEGGFAATRTLSWLAEKEPEYIVPVSKVGSFAAAFMPYSAAYAPAGGDGGNRSINVTVAPVITITATGSAKADDIAHEVESIMIKSVRSGRFRKEVQNAANGK